jgi:hypothetical protein
MKNNKSNNKNAEEKTTKMITSEKWTKDDNKGKIKNDNI